MRMPSVRLARPHLTILYNTLPLIFEDEGVVPIHHDFCVAELRFCCMVAPIPAMIATSPGIA
ncbi:MAG: hypothetical protein NVS3B14_10960 [Ktedonobacteraceae bacterium]